MLGPPSEVQLGAARRMRIDAEAFCSSVKSMERRDWSAEKSGHVLYDGEVAKEVEPSARAHRGGASARGSVG